MTDGTEPTRRDDIYVEADLTRLYDLFNHWGPGDEFYLALARESGGPVLDLGCGTGMAAVRFAEAGIAMTGADPAAGMLAVARTRPGADRVAWVQAGGQNLNLHQRFALVYMTGHAFQALLTDAEALAVLRGVARHLAARGRFAFDTRNPEAREWLSWTTELSREVVVSPADGRVEESCDTTYDPVTGIAEIAHRYRFLDRGTELAGRSRIRFIGRAEVELLLAEAGLRPVACYGDWDRSLCGPRRPEIIMVAEKA